MTDGAQMIIPGRPVRHPGTTAEARTTALVGTTRPFTSPEVLDAARHGGTGEDLGVLLSTGSRPLFDVMVAAVEATGAGSGVVEFSGLALPRISYCFPAYGDPVRPMLYSETQESSGVVLQGTATVGFRREQGSSRLSRWIHFHIAWIDAEGRTRGGHLWPETTMAGSLTNAVVWPLYGITLVNAHDEETWLPVFTPEPALAGGEEPAGDRRAVFARVRPNEEIVDTVDALTRKHRLEGGTVRGGTGSLVGGATFAEGVLTAGPATEVISLSGELGRPAENGISPLTCTFVISDGSIRGGRLRTEGNIVGATYDLMLAGPPHP